MDDPEHEPEDDDDDHSTSSKISIKGGLQVNSNNSASTISARIK